MLFSLVKSTVKTVKTEELENYKLLFIFYCKLANFKQV